MSGRPNSSSGVASPGRFSQCPSIAAIFAVAQGVKAHAFIPPPPPGSAPPAAPSTSPSTAFCGWPASRCRAEDATRQTPRRTWRYWLAGYRHMEQAIRKRGVKDNRQPVLRDEMAIFDDKTLRRLHPALWRPKDQKGNHVPSAAMQVVKNATGGTLFSQTASPRESLQEEGRSSTSYSSSRPISASELGKSAQLVPN